MKASAVSKFKISTAAMKDMPCTWRKEKHYIQQELHSLKNTATFCPHHH